ncbi:MAG TPA: hypothetical protein VEP90_21305 [Methylomirabilota bacterium]|nr:hypothetical protein [Methylomirabilota bacterium]
MSVVKSIVPENGKKLWNAYYPSRNVLLGSFETRTQARNAVREARFRTYPGGMIPGRAKPEPSGHKE